MSQWIGLYLESDDSRATQKVGHIPVPEVLSESSNIYDLVETVGIVEMDGRVTMEKYEEKKALQW